MFLTGTVPVGDPLLFHNSKPFDNIGGAMLAYNGTFDLHPVQADRETCSARKKWARAQKPAAGGDPSRLDSAYGASNARREMTNRQS